MRAAKGETEEDEIIIYMSRREGKELFRDLPKYKKGTTEKNASVRDRLYLTLEMMTRF